jgi:hypothetical protein
MNAIWRGGRREYGGRAKQHGRRAKRTQAQNASAGLRFMCAASGKRRPIAHQPRCAPGARRARKTLLYNADDIARFLFT